MTTWRTSKSIGKNSTHSQQKRENRHSSQSQAVVSQHHQILQLQKTLGNQQVLQLLGMGKPIQRVTTKDADKRKRVDVPFGYGAAGSLEEYNFHSSGFNSCNAVAMYNHDNKKGGLFHLLGRGVAEATDGLTQMFQYIRPTQISLYNGAFGNEPGDQQQIRKGLQDSWKKDHSELQQLFNKLKDECNYDEEGKDLTIIEDQQPETSTLSVVMDDSSDYQGVRGQKGNKFITTPMAHSINKSAVEKSEEHGIPLFSSRNAGGIVDDTDRTAEIELEKQRLLTYDSRCRKARDDQDLFELDSIYMDIEPLGKNKTPISYNDFAELTSVNYKARIIVDYIEILIKSLK